MATLSKVILYSSNLKAGAIATREGIAIATRHRRLPGFVASQPEVVPLGIDLPLAVAVCAVTLPDGCRPPPGPLAQRMAAGAGADIAAATRSAAMEAAERYSLQYRNGDPTKFAPVPRLSTHDTPAVGEAVLLGHPRGDGLSSTGAAAGRSLSDAAGRALLEHLEHEALIQWKAGATAVPLLLSEGRLRSLSETLRAHRRRLFAYATAPATGAAAVFCVCCEEDGAAPAIGSAAGTNLAHTTERAADEAIFLWRNLAAIANRGVPIDQMAPRDRALLRDYLGHWEGETAERPRPIDEIAAGFGLDVTAPSTFLARCRKAGALRFRSFDLTRPEVRIPVARVLLDGPVSLSQP